eukprot:TRINITY_DN51189_c0_g1_i1.p1 TRINITY_DN51189_c0_g1~~TRINITY_DN51189_c0_g1_i1.p1  ORF type:complete len:167 (+),score=20.59 TRINITY_DN51189_c0_g1_i1:146-646(+)
MRKHIQKVTMRAGSVVLWDSRLPHGNFPNESGKWRLCQYLGFHPAPSTRTQPGLVKGIIEQMMLERDTGRLPESILDTALGPKLVGLHPWESPPERVISSLTCRQLGWDDSHESDPLLTQTPKFRRPARWSGVDARMCLCAALVLALSVLASCGGVLVLCRVLAYD